MDNTFDEERLNREDLDLPVSKIYACAYKNEANEGDKGSPPTNHWAFFVPLSPSKSVSIDILPGYGFDGLRTNVVLTSEEVEFTTESIKRLTFPFKKEIKLRQIYCLLWVKKLDRYIYNEEWEGCRFWVYSVISELEAIGWIEEGSKKTAMEALSHYWAYPSGCEPREIKEGKWY